MERVFTYLWEYEVKSENQIPFIKLYGIEGNWVQFYKKSEGYLATEIHQDIDNQERFITIDYWKSKEACDNYRVRNQLAYNRLDVLGDLLTQKEIKIGEFYSYKIDDRLLQT